MAEFNSVFQKSFEAGSIFTAAYVVCVLGSTDNQVTLPTIDGQQAIGIVQGITTAASGQAVPVMIYGISKAVANGALSAGDHLGAIATSGYLDKLTGLTGASENQVGIALKAASAQGEIIPVLLTPGAMYIKGVLSSVSPSASKSPSSSVSPSSSASSSPSPSA